MVIFTLDGKKFLFLKECINVNQKFERIDEALSLIEREIESLLPRIKAHS